MPRFSGSARGYRLCMTRWVVVEVESDNRERRYARVRHQIPMPDPLAAGVVLLQTEVWGGPDDGDLRFVQVYTHAAEEILDSLDQR